MPIIQSRRRFLASLPAIGAIGFASPSRQTPNRRPKPPASA